MRNFSTSAGNPDLVFDLLESAPDAMVVADRDGRIVLVNRRAEKLFGYSRAEVLGQPVEVLLPERSRSRHCQHRTRYLDEPRGQPMGKDLEVFCRRKEGSEFPAEIHLSCVETGAGLMISSVIRDVSERRKRKEEHVQRRAEAKRAEAERYEKQRELFRLLFENSPEPVTVSRLTDGKYLAVNEAFLRLTQH